MNTAMQREADWAWVAGLLDGRASVFLTKAGSRDVIKLKFYFLPQTGRAPIEKLRAMGRRVGEEGKLPKRDGTHYWALFVGEEAVKILLKAYSYLTSEHRRKQAQLAFRFYKTLKRRGIHIAEEEREARQQIRLELVALTKSPEDKCQQSQKIPS